MPQLPRYESQGQVSANGRVIAIPVRKADTAVGDALKDVGAATFEFGARLQQSKVDAELVKADRETRTRLDQIKFGIESDATVPDEEVPQRFRTQSEAAIGEIAGTISSSSARKLWTERAKGLQDDGDLWSQKLSRTRATDKVRAGHVTTAAELETQAGDLALSAESYAKNLEESRQAVRRDVERGFLNSEDAARQLAGLDRLGVKDRTLRVSANVDALVKAGRVAEAEAMFTASAGQIDPLARDQIKKGLDAASLDAKAQAQGDEIWTKAGRDYAKALPLLEKITNPIERDAVERRVAQLKTMEDAAERDAKEGAQDALWQHVLGGGKISTASRALLGRLDPGQLGSIRAFEDARDHEAGLSASGRAAAKQASEDTFASLMAASLNPDLGALFVAGPGSREWIQNGTQAMFSSMMPEQQIKMLEEVTKRRSGSTSAKGVGDAYNQVLDVLKRAPPPGYLFNATPTQRAANKAGDTKTSKIEGAIYREVTKYMNDTGASAATIPLDEAKRMIVRSLSAAGETNGVSELQYGLRPTVPNSPLRPGAGAPSRVGSLVVKDPDLYKIAVESVGPGATNMQIAAEYARLEALQ